MEDRFEEAKRRLVRNMVEKYQREGSPLVRKDKLKEWNEYVEENTQDPYSAEVVRASIRVMKALSEGKTPKEAEKEIAKMKLSGCMEGFVAQAVAYFHPRGEEFGRNLNRDLLPEEEAEKSEGVVNPAILKITLPSPQRS